MVVKAATRQAVLPEWALDLMARLAPLNTREQTARALAKSTKSIDRAIRARELECVRAGRRILVPARAIVDYLLARNTSGSSLRSPVSTHAAPRRLEASS